MAKWKYNRQNLIEEVNHDYDANIQNIQTNIYHFKKDIELNKLKTISFDVKKALELINYLEDPKTLNCMDMHELDVINKITAMFAFEKEETK